MGKTKRVPFKQWFAQVLAASLVVLDRCDGCKRAGDEFFMFDGKVYCPHCWERARVLGMN